MCFSVRYYGQPNNLIPSHKTYHLHHNFHSLKNNTWVHIVVKERVLGFMYGLPTHTHIQIKDWQELFDSTKCSSYSMCNCLKYWNKLYFWNQKLKHKEQIICLFSFQRISTPQIFLVFRSSVIRHMGSCLSWLQSALNCQRRLNTSGGEFLGAEDVAHEQECWRIQSSLPSTKFQIPRLGPQMFLNNSIFVCHTQTLSK